MKDSKTFLKLQEAAVNKQSEAKKQGYEGNTTLYDLTISPLKTI
jgi:hypothetical protein